MENFLNIYKKLIECKIILGFRKSSLWILGNKICDLLLLKMKLNNQCFKGKSKYDYLNINYLRFFQIYTTIQYNSPCPIQNMLSLIRFSATCATLAGLCF